MSPNLPRTLANLSGAVVLSLAPMLATATSAQAEIEYPYCMMQGKGTPQSCTFTTLDQCRASLSGGAGYCDTNPRYVAAPQLRHRR